MILLRLLSLSFLATLCHSFTRPSLLFSSKKTNSLQAATLLSKISIGGGAAGILILLINRLVSMDTVTDIQSRADIISMIACSGLLLNAFSEQDITAKEREAVPLVGFSLRTPIISDDVNPNLASYLKWLSDSIIRNTPATSVHVFSATGLLSQAGVVSRDPALAPAPAPPAGNILMSVMNGEDEVYLPDLQILPGKIEFTYLPLNCQSVLILRAASGLAIVVGTNRAKAMKAEDLGRIRTLVELMNNLVL